MTGRIYKLYSHYTGHSFFGFTTQSFDSFRRLCQSRLRSGRHHNKALQQLAHEYGWESIVLVEVESEVLESEAQEKLAKYMQMDLCLNRKALPPRPAKRGTAVTWEGIAYPSLAAASRATGLSVRQLQYRLSYQIESEAEMIHEPFAPPTVRCILDDVEYPSLAAAARATGHNYGYVRRFARRVL